MRLFITGGLLLLLSAAAAQDCSSSLRGHVEDRDTRDLLAGATVVLQPGNRRVVTDSAGNFTVPDLCAGIYQVQISHLQCDSLVKTVRIRGRQHVDFYLPHAAATLGLVTVQAGKGIARTGFKKELSGEALFQTRGQSLAEALSNLNGVNMLQTGSTIAKPVVHGLHGSRLLLINNGVRQEAQQWGNEHAPEIDPFIADKMVVIKGVDELRYGSDAVGGVILVDPKPLRSQPGSSAELNTGFATNNRQYYVSGQWEQQASRLPALTYRVQGTIRQGANTATPAYTLNNTAHREYDGSINLRYKKPGWQTELFYSIFSAKLGIFTGSHIGNLTDLLQAIEADRPADVFTGQKTYSMGRPYQAVTHQLLKSKTIVQQGASAFQLQLAAQFNQRKEYDVVRSSSNTRPQLQLDIVTLTEDLSWEHPAWHNLKGSVGLALMQQDNSYQGRYLIPNYQAFNTGAYWLEKWARHQWELQGGLRFDHRNISTTRLKINNDTINHDFSFNTFAASFYGIFKPGNGWRMQAGFSASSRAPYVNELLSDGIHHGTATFEKGDIALQPERSLYSTVSVQYNDPAGKYSVELLGYNNRLNDFIYQVPKPDSPVLTIAGAFPLMQFTQTDAVLKGIDLMGTVNPVPAVQLSAKTSLLYARNRRTDDWLIGMPANRWSAGIQYELPLRRRISEPVIGLMWTQVSRQRRFPDESNGKQDYKSPPPAYGLLQADIHMQCRLGKQALSIGITGYNLLNTRYRDYLNSMRYFTDEAGRNISVRLRLPLSFSSTTNSHN
ncbi:MAG: TonB-dependent receptor [Flavihumibacter sp.]